MKKIDYSVGDFLIRLKNAALASKKEVAVPKTKYIEAVGKVLKEVNYIDQIKDDDKNLIFSLAFSHKKPRLTDVKLVSKPGLRVYKSKSEIKNWKSPSIYVLSTSKGVLTSKQAVKAGVGGEVIAEIL